MKDPNNKFDDIIRNKLSDFELPGSEDDWHQLELDLDKKSFWKWGFNHFNVYYTSLLILLIGSIFVLIYTGSVQQTEKIVSDSASQKNNPVIISSSNTNAFIDESKNKKVNRQFSTFRNTKDTSSDLDIKLSKDTLSDVKQLLKDTSATSSNSLPIDSTQKKKVKKQKKTIVIQKRDTIIAADTLRKVRRK